MPTFEKYVDFIYADKQCYEPYDKSDYDTYSTFLFRDKAVSAINSHDFQAQPMFLYLAFQGVHDPFDDIMNYPSGIPAEYLPDGDYEMFQENIPGQTRMQYAMALRLVDDAVAAVVKSLEDVGQMDNTYLIVTSDNGGCMESGGRNNGLRGNKGSLYEGIVR